MGKLFSVTWRTGHRREHEAVFEAADARAARRAFERWHADREGRHPGPHLRPWRVTVRRIV